MVLLLVDVGGPTPSRISLLLPPVRVLALHPPPGLKHLSIVCPICLQLGLEQISMEQFGLARVIARACDDCGMGFLCQERVVSYRVRLAMTSLDFFRVKRVLMTISHSLGIDAMMMVQNV